MRIFALISALAAFVAAVAGAAVRVDTSCVLGIGLGDFESCVALSTGPPDIEIRHIGLIEVLDEKNKRLGYISKNLYKDGQFTYDASVGNALPVSFTTTGTGISTRLNVGTTYMNTSFPLVGLVQGYDDTDSDLKPNSWQYLYFGGITVPGTPPGARPSQVGNSCTYATGKARTGESAVWTYDSTSNALTPQWINTDGSPPSEDLFFWGSAAVLYVSGNKEAFHIKYPTNPVITIKFRFVPAEGTLLND